MNRGIGSDPRVIPGRIPREFLEEWLASQPLLRPVVQLRDKNKKQQKKKPGHHQMSEPIEFRIGRKVFRGGDRVYHDGHQLDIKKLISMVGGRAATPVRIATLSHTTRARRSGFKPIKLKHANGNTPIIITHGRETVDGRHRVIKKKATGATHINAIKVTRKDLDAVKMSNPNHTIRLSYALDRIIEFDSGWTPELGKAVTWPNGLSLRYDPRKKPGAGAHFDRNLAKYIGTGTGLGAAGILAAVRKPGLKTALTHSGILGGSGLVAGAVIDRGRKRSGLKGQIKERLPGDIRSAMISRMKALGERTTPLEREIAEGRKRVVPLSDTSELIQLGDTTAGIWKALRAIGTKNKSRGAGAVIKRPGSYEAAWEKFANRPRPLFGKIKRPDTFSAALDDVIAFGDPRPRNAMGQFEDDDSGTPSPNSMARTYGPAIAGGAATGVGFAGGGIALKELIKRIKGVKK